MRTRIHYSQPEGSVVVSQNGVEVLHYDSVEALVETHIKGLMIQTAEDKDSKQLSRLKAVYYRPLSNA